MKKRFYLDKANGRIFGVCSGIARHMGWDPTFVRVGVVLVTLLGAFPWTLVTYVAAAMIAKNRPADGYGDEVPTRLARTGVSEPPRIRTSSEVWRATSKAARPPAPLVR